jgi:hypothetical protein
MVAENPPDRPGGLSRLIASLLPARVIRSLSDEQLQLHAAVQFRDDFISRQAGEETRRGERTFLRDAFTHALVDLAEGKYESARSYLHSMPDLVKAMSEGKNKFVYTPAIADQELIGIYQPVVIFFNLTDSQMNVYRAATTLLQQSGYRTLPIRDEIPGVVLSFRTKADTTDAFAAAHENATFVPTLLHHCVETAALFIRHLSPLSTTPYRAEKILASLRSSSIPLSPQGFAVAESLMNRHRREKNEQRIPFTDRCLPNNFIDVNAYTDEEIYAAIVADSKQKRSFPEALRTADMALLQQFYTHLSETVAIERFRNTPQHIAQVVLTADFETLDQYTTHGHNIADILYKTTKAFTYEQRDVTRRQYCLALSVPDTDSLRIQEVTRLIRLADRYPEYTSIPSLAAEQFSDVFSVPLVEPTLAGIVDACNTHSEKIIAYVSR